MPAPTITITLSQASMVMRMFLDQRLITRRIGNTLALDFYTDAINALAAQDPSLAQRRDDHEALVARQEAMRCQ
jgi:hypothetical protein